MCPCRDSLKVATLQPSAAAVIAGDTRKWSALKIDGAGGSLSLGGALTATVTGVAVEVNSASGALGATQAAPIDWSTITAPGSPPRSSRSAWRARSIRCRSPM